MANSYTGQLTGRPQTRELDGLTIVKASVSAEDNNAYLLTDRATGDAVLIDAADDADAIRALIGEPGRLGQIITTHRHWDHHRALPDVAAGTGAATLAGAPDAADLPVTPDHRLDNGDEIRFGESTLQVIALRGHTPGSIALLYRDPRGSAHLFTGDSLFPGGPGKTTTRDDFTSLMDDLESRVFAGLPDDTWVYPGHGDDTTLGAERPHLEEWRERGW
ncbi:MBL fold metallo-hydrolase [Spelaeicoccus albus]|uniref:Glyoxylase-like metal-dependent hydrolase (Beta-lactamase superfamily II) n=1 Tax=Spelaeicoccus albus TaxID=1280376 RepID=A0A7Z0D481_9MICO|nr:MBL fold metallo-hydrolase [Spelaeicoccus albus]NYI68545.1 glyoxylase-like metal-dependent hydrolase (beta-lactamase superfamily II) [Spelaeicoccus albus]